MIIWTGLIPMAAVIAGLIAGERLPALRGEFLTGRRAELPEAAEGRVALLLLGFSYDSRYAVEAWAKRFREEFHSDSRVTFYEIPMIGGMARLGKWFIDSGMRRGTAKEDYENVITVYGNNGDWKRRVQFQDANAAYLILLDRAGKVAWRHAGKFDEAAFLELSAKIVALRDAR